MKVFLLLISVVVVSAVDASKSSTRTLILTSAGAVAVTTVTSGVEIGVKGMVCDFCARAVEKVFKKEQAVESIKVDLKTKKVGLRFKPGQNLEDGRVRQLIEDSGYDFVDIKKVP